MINHQRERLNNMGFSLGGAIRGGLTGFATGGWAGAAAGALGGGMSKKLSGREGYDSAAGNIRFQPFNIRSGFGNTTWSGNTGSFSLSPEYQSIRDEALGSAKGFFSQAKSFDPNAASSNAYGLMQQIAAPGRARELANLRDTLYGQGRLGAADATGGNPELRAFYEAQNQADLQALLQSIGLGQGLLDSTIQRGQGFLTTATGLDAQGNDLMKLGLWSGQGGLDATKAQSDLLAKGGEAETSFWNTLIGAGAKAYSSSGGGSISGVPIGKIIGDWFK